ncbi:nicotinate-nucleotide--dimethylbenzimidazole phosphoribosyltransferase [Streptomyces netropsis]|uniref:nicotinate-nucleotide--dimethylbenzimidazole phosphoribosyltransferase n=1 Tax=Streptomyces netropsis TaxID=55404 RepID=UPI0037910BB7
MTDTGQFPGEGQPENAGALTGQPHPAEAAAPADTGTPSYTFLDAADGTEEDDLLLMPGAQGAWMEQPAVQGGTHESGGRDTGSVDYGDVRVPPPATPSRRPLHMGPPVPDPTGGVVRSLADRGPAAPQPVQPVPVPVQQPGPEYLDVPRAEPVSAQVQQPGAAPAQPGPWDAQPQQPQQSVPAPAVPSVSAVPSVPSVPSASSAPAATAAPQAAFVPQQATGGPSEQATGAPVSVPGQSIVADEPSQTAVQAVVEPTVETAAPIAPAVPVEPAATVVAEAPDAPENVTEPVAPVAPVAATPADEQPEQTTPAAPDAVAQPADAVQQPATAPIPDAQPVAAVPQPVAPVAEPAQPVPAVAPDSVSVPAQTAPGPDTVSTTTEAPDAPVVPQPVAEAAPAAEPEPTAPVVPTTTAEAPEAVTAEPEPEAQAAAPVAAEPQPPVVAPAPPVTAEAVPEAAPAQPEQHTPADVPVAAAPVVTAPQQPAQAAAPVPAEAAQQPVPAEAAQQEQAPATAVAEQTPVAAVPEQPAAPVAPVAEATPEEPTDVHQQAAESEPPAQPVQAVADAAPQGPVVPPAAETPESVPGQQDTAPVAPAPAEPVQQAPAAVATPPVTAEAVPEAAPAQPEPQAPADATDTEGAQQTPDQDGEPAGQAEQPPVAGADAATPAEPPHAAPEGAPAAAPATPGQQDSAAVHLPTTPQTVPDPAAEAPGAPEAVHLELVRTEPEQTEAAPQDPAAALAEESTPAEESAGETVPAEESAPAEEPAEEPLPAEPAGPAAVGYGDAERAAVHRVMRERRDIRKGFRTDPIPHEVLLRVLEAAHTAPSVGHSQPWDFVVIRSAETRQTMHELAARQRDAYAKSLPKGRAKQFKELKIEAILDTPVNIVVTADPTRGGRHTLGRHTQPQMAPYSSALAVENLWLAARAEGLGVGWVSFFDEREMVRELGLPEHLEVVAYLCVGYVDEFPDEPELMQAGWSKRRPLSWVVHEEEYGRRALPGEDPHDLLAETLRGIRPLDAKALGEAWERQKRMTKPSGALGMLEIISAQLCGLSRKCPPPIPEPAAVAIFAGDHGVHAQGVTAWPQEVTSQMVANFLGGGAVCNAFANQVGAEVCVVDVGVAGELPSTPGLLPRKIRPGTNDFTTGPAMSREEALRAVEVGIETARDLVAAGNKALLTGEMGIANTTVSAALISIYTEADPGEITGRGTGINDEMHARKIDVVRRALELHQPDPKDPIGVLAAVGGLEHAALVGLILGGASLRTPVILDGVSAGAAALVARAIAPEALAACIAGHRSAEPGHVAALTKLGLRPLVDLDLRLGEGTGALLALPVVQSAARAMHEVATFDSAGVAEKG